MKERPLDNITFLGKGKLRVNIGGREILITEKAAPREGIDRNPERPRFPEGTIESLMPILRGPFLDFGASMDESYWAQLDEDARFSPETACAKLRHAGIDHATVARALLGRDENLQIAKAFGRVSEEQAQALESVVAREVLKYYKPYPSGVK